MLDFLFYPTPCTIDFCPEDIYHWDICQHYVTPEGVPLDICKYSKYVATFYRGRLVAYIHYYDKVLSVEPAADPGTFYVDVPGGANIRIHYDHIEYINGYYDKVVTDWKGFEPKEIKVCGEDSLWGGVTAKRFRKKESFSPTVSAREINNEDANLDALRARAAESLADSEQCFDKLYESMIWYDKYTRFLFNRFKKRFLAQEAGNALYMWGSDLQPPSRYRRRYENATSLKLWKGVIAQLWEGVIAKRSRQRESFSPTRSRTSLRSHSPPTNSSITAPLRGPPLR